MGSEALQHVFEDADLERLWVKAGLNAYHLAKWLEALQYSLSNQELGWDYYYDMSELGDDYGKMYPSV